MRSSFGLSQLFGVEDKHSFKDFESLHEYIVCAIMPEAATTGRWECDAEIDEKRKER